MRATDGEGSAAAGVDLQSLRRVSAAIGSDRLLIQGAGGNVSVKSGDTMWIKASGTWLSEAEDRNIMVPVALAPESGEDFVVRDGGASGLRPSIETSMHAVLPQAVILHAHSVDVIALAVRADAAALLQDKLAGLRWALVPYARPGAPLTRAIVESVNGAEVDVLVLANHGIVVMAANAAAAEALLAEVVARVSAPPREAPHSAPGSAEAVTAQGFHAPADAETHMLAIDPVSLAIAEGGPLYPDHVVFLGPAPLVIDPHMDFAEALERFSAAGNRSPKWVIVRGIGIAVSDDIARGGEEMLRCLSDVAARIPPGAPLCCLSDTDIAALTEWDAEQYRQQLARAGA